MSVPTIYAFKQNEDGSVLDIIACCGYHADQEGDRERAIKEIQDSIQWLDVKNLLVIDGIKLPVIPINIIKNYNQT
jgi:hypothetical protein